MNAKQWRDFALLHAALAAAAGLIYWQLAAPQLGIALLLLVVSYNIALPLLAKQRGYSHWLQRWLFLLPLSVFQVLPDWFLSAGLGTLVFPDLGAPRIGTVSAYMAGMWVIPLFWVLLLARNLISAAALAVLIFAAAEWIARPLGLWHAQQVHLQYGVAPYVLLPEALLGAACFWGYDYSLKRSRATALLTAAMISTLYTGGLALSWLFLERLG